MEGAEAHEIDRGLEHRHVIQGRVAREPEGHVFVTACRIPLGLDADAPGREAAEKLQEEYEQKGYTVSVRLPAPGKDWNELLQNQVFPLEAGAVQVTGAAFAGEHRLAAAVPAHEHAVVVQAVLVQKASKIQTISIKKGGT